MDGALGLGQLLGDRLKAIRSEGGLTQEDVARRARQVGLPWSRATGEMEVRAAYKFHIEPLQVSLEAFKNFGRGLTQERDRRFGEAARRVSLRSLGASRGHISRIVLRELAPRLRQRKLKLHLGRLQIVS